MTIRFTFEIQSPHIKDVFQYCDNWHVETQVWCHSFQCQKGLYEIEPKRPLLLILKALFCLPSNLSPLLTLQQYIYILLLVGSPQYFERGAALLMSRG